MRRSVTISILLLGLFLLGSVDASPMVTDVAHEVANQTEQISISHHRYVDADQPSSVVVPTARTITINGSRTHISRAPQIATTGHFHTISNYVVAHFVHRLGSLPRAVDFYLYTLCRLRL